MKKNKLVKGLSLAILVGLWGGGVAHAKATATTPNSPNSAGATTQAPRNARDPIQSHNKRQEMPLSARKESAKRLKKHHQQEQQQHRLDGTKTQGGVK